MWLVKAFISTLLGLEHHWILQGVFATVGLEPESMLQSYLLKSLIHSLSANFDQILFSGLRNDGKKVRQGLCLQGAGVLVDKEQTTNTINKQECNR